MTDKWHVLPALFVRLVLLDAAAKMPLEEAALVAGSYQNLSNLLFFRYLCYKLSPSPNKEGSELIFTKKTIDIKHKESDYSRHPSPNKEGSQLMITPKNQ